MFNTLKRLLCFLIKLHDMTMACYSHLQCEELADVACLRHAEYPHWMCLSPTLVWGKKDSVSSTHEKSLPKLSRLLRYLADSNRRPRFCRPIPNHSGKVPFCGCKDTTFWRTAIYFFGEPQYISKFFFKPSLVPTISTNSMQSGQRKAHHSIHRRVSSLYDANGSSRMLP